MRIGILKEGRWMFLIHPLRQLGGGIILLMAAFCALAQPAGAQM